MQCDNNPRKLYGLLNSITGVTTENPLPTNDDELANEFLDFFMEKIQKIRDALDNCPKYSPNDKNAQRFESFRLLSESEVESIIRSMPTKSCELDIIPTHLLKEILSSILVPITHLINMSLKSGEFSLKWKEAIIRPLLKKSGLDCILNNYRPVSNLPFLSKVIEKAVLLQFGEHCDNNKLMAEYQSAYRPYHSCETAVVKLTNDLLWNMERQQLTLIVATDLSAAFDTVDFDITLDVLERCYGVCGTAKIWFNNYLRPRFCKVNIKNSFSATRELHQSVPQGSCLGPVLYSCYASTLQTVVPQSVNIHGYVDDQIFKCSYFPDLTNKSNEEETVSMMQQSISNLSHWMNENRLKLNVDKTEVIITGSIQQLKKCTRNSISLCDSDIDISDCIKYLGVKLDSKVSFKQQIQSKCKTAMFNLLRIKRIRHLLTEDACHTVVRGLVLSQLDYCNAVYAGLPDVDLDKLQRIQNIAAKLVKGASKFDSPRRCCEELHWLPVRARIRYKILCLVYKCVNGIGPPYLENLLVKAPVRREGLRSGTDQNKLIIPFTKLKTFAARSFSCIGPTYWNQLPKDLRICSSLYQFKKTLKTHLYQLSYNS